ncbi:ABC transporter ATP-binding protein [Lacticaseibacillus mingshuiensis]|uniref:ABC transporter ATP-binding protein n=1 Tax=Lacticaseibacillus mingshuiensis TaxID=2799574 RepID=A0ABW4CK07_9LACO|nr:ABC transporter ATP-binding protein [Lacticaseibacillus mingshuiensis]
MGEMIEFSHVTKQFADNTAVADLNLAIRAGELFVLVGTSGSGKTTTLKMINRLVAPTSGTITFDGKALGDFNLRRLRWDIGYVLQQIALFPTMTVGQNIALIPEMKKWPRAKVKQAVDEGLRSVGLDPKTYRDRLPSELSGGEQQRIGILRALVARPPVILMDEPFSALDPLSRTQLQDLVLELHARLGMTIVFVTHDMNEAMRLGDRIAVMKEGHLLQVGTPTEIAEAPANTFVADFFASAQRSPLSVAVASLAPYGTAVAEAGEGPGDSDAAQRSGASSAKSAPVVSGQMTLSELLPELAESNHVTVKAQEGNFELSASAVLRYLADNEKEQSK